MSHYSTWENTKRILATTRKQLTVTQVLLTLHSSLRDISPARDTSAVQVAVHGTARKSHVPLAIISVSVQIWI